jgi:hypothetical protein
MFFVEVLVILGFCMLDLMGVLFLFVLIRFKFSIRMLFWDWSLVLWIRK